MWLGKQKWGTQGARSHGAWWANVRAWVSKEKQRKASRNTAAIIEMVRSGSTQDVYFEDGVHRILLMD